jgi:Ran GTPase-activating protein (RanGAP) involved in mRNA processing and transport
VVALSAAVFDHLEMLRLDHNAIGPEGAAALARATHWTRLNALDLFRNFIGDRGAAAFLASPFPALTSLRTSFNGISPEFQAALQEKFPRPFPLQ